jgi:[glutamine synthetase] adenylyltransferase / [glutamine synthetase]-adenylyl-L-tyrosine phosphorylase
MLEEYFQVQGREWERFAWLKSRVVAPRAAVTSGRATALRSLVTPFVYRRYLDYGVFEGLRQLHQKIRDEAQRRAAGRPERANDVKLSRGGIREIEFIVQLMLVVRGGQFPELRTRSTLRGLQRLASRGLMPADTAGAGRGLHLPAARRAPHPVPRRPADAPAARQRRRPGWIAAQPGPGCRPRRGPTPCLRAARPAGRGARVRGRRVRHPAASERPGAGPAARGTPPWGLPQLRQRPAAGGQRKAAREAAARAGRTPAQLVPQPRVQALRDDSRLRLGRLMQRAGRAVAEGSCTEAAALRFVDWVEPLLRRESYLALLAERPEVQHRLLRLLGLARWPMQYLMRHPGVIDELADSAWHTSASTPRPSRRTRTRRAAWQRSGEDDEESCSTPCATPTTPRSSARWCATSKAS